MSRAVLPALLALLLVASGGWWWANTSGSPAPRLRTEAGEKAGKAARGRGKAKAIRQRGPVYEDPANNVPADPPARAIAIIAPTSIAGAAPAARVATAPASPPNVVLILGCTVRKDQVTPYGGHPDATPWLSGLAARGVVFDDTIAAAPWTRAASTAVLTGHHPITVGMVEPSNRRNDRKLPDSVTTIAERMAERGYLTLGATANPNLGAGFGFGQGFDAYQEGLTANWKHKLKGKEVVDATVDSLEARRADGDERPFFLRMMLLDPHAPRHKKGGQLNTWKEDDVPARVWQYRAHLAEFDAALAHLEARLQGLGMADDTVFVVVSDHGEGMSYPRHHGFGHGQYPSSSTVHAVWLMGGPGVAAGHRVLGVSSQVDILPTVLGTIGQPLTDPSSAEGTDWSAQVRGEAGATTADAVFVDTWFQESNRAAIFTPTHQCQADFGSSERQQARGKFQPGCFDRHADPLFTTTVEVPDLPEQLAAWREGREAALAGAVTETVEVSEELAGQLEMLGYHE